MTLASFAGPNGARPGGGLVEDSSGNLFGTTSGDGDGATTVFEVKAGSGTATTLANFASTDASNPNGGVVEDSSGNLFGTAAYGGAVGDGIVYEVKAGSGTITTIATFNGTNGGGPYAGLIEDANGNLFGVSSFGGTFSDGTVFEVKAGSGTITTLASFDGTDGVGGAAGLVEDSSGNLFGDTAYGGVGYQVNAGQGDGTVFEVKAGSGSITTLASFNSTTGNNSFGSPVEDRNGNLFGTTLNGGTFNDGTIFEVKAGSGAITTLASFDGTNGENPYAGLVEDSSGDFFGTTTSGGAGAGSGTIFELPSGSATISTLVDFDGTNGQNPFGGLIMDSNGNFFGDTEYGAPFGSEFGTVFEFSDTETSKVEAVTQSATFSTASQSVSLSAAVTNTDSTSVNGGTVTFTLFRGSAQVGQPVTSSTVANGVADAILTLPQGALAGTYAIHVSYSGTPTEASSNNSADTTFPTLTISPAATSVEATAQAAPFSAADQSVTLHATVSSTTGSNSNSVNEGVVIFSVFDGATQIGSTVTSGLIVNGAASALFTLPGGTAAGNYSIEVSFAATADYIGSNNSSDVTFPTLFVDPVSSSVATLPIHSPGTFTLNWSGTDSNGTPLSTYNIYVSTNGGAFSPLLMNSTQTSTTFTGSNGNTYEFYSIATDTNGFVQMTPSIAQATTNVDSLPPTSSVTALPSYSSSATFPVAWSGTDNLGGSGIASYSIYVSDNGSAFSPWLTNITQTSATYSGVDGNSYAFYSVATDAVGNQQPPPTAAQATTAVDMEPPTSSVVTLPVFSPGTFTLSWSGSHANDIPISSYSIYVSNNGGSFTPLLSDTTLTSTSFTGENGHTYAFYSVATDMVGDTQPTPDSAQASTKVDTAAPASSVTPLPTFSPATFTVNWAGNDNSGGSGLASFSVYVSDNGGSFTPLLTGTVLNSTSFTGTSGHTYRFYSIATDNVGNVQPTPSSSQASTTVDAIPPTSAVVGLPSDEGADSFAVIWQGEDNTGGSGIAFFNVYANVDGGAFAIWQSHTTATSATYTGQNGHTYGFYSVATDNVGNDQPTPSSVQASTTIAQVASRSLSTVTLSPSTIQVGATTTVTFHAVDASGHALTSGGLTVTFSVSTGNADGTFGSTTDNQNGTYSTIFTADTVAGSCTIEGAIGAQPLTSAAPTLTEVGGPATKFSVVLASTATADTPIEETITALDAYNNVATGYTGTVSFSSSDHKAILPAAYTFTSADAGSHTFNIAFEDAGNQTVQVIDNNSPVLHQQASVSVKPDFAAITSGPQVSTLTNALGQGEVISLQSTGRLVLTSAAGSTTLLDNQAQSVAAGASPTGQKALFDLKSSGLLYQYSAGVWTLLDNEAQAIVSGVSSAGQSVLFDLKKTGLLYQYAGGAWTLLDNQAQTIVGATAPGGKPGLFDLKKTGALYQYSSGAWSLLDGQAQTIAGGVSSAGQPVLFDLKSNGWLYQYSAGVWSSPLDKQAQSIAVGYSAPGKEVLFDLKTTGGLYQYSAGIWTTLDNQAQIAVAGVSSAGQSALFDLKSNGVIYEYAGGVWSGPLDTEAETVWIGIASNGLDELFEQKTNDLVYYYSGGAWHLEP